MSKKSKFVNFVNDNLFSKINVNEIDPDIVAYWDGLAGEKVTDKPTFTDNGKLVMKYMQTLPADVEPKTAKAIAEEMYISSRTVSGCMRKLCEDGFAEKIGKEPTLYTLTEKGKNIIID